MSARRFGVLKVASITTLLVMLIVFFRSGSPYGNMYQTVSLFCHMLLSFGLVIYRMTHVGKAVSGRFVLCMTGLFISSVVVSMVINQEVAAYRNYLVQIMMCVDAVLLVQIFGVERFSTLWLKSFRIISLMSVILYAMIALGINFFPIIRTDEHIRYYTIGIVSQLVMDARTSGTFWEPSMFAVFMAYTLFLEMQAGTSWRNKRRHIIVESIALLLTGSMSALVYLVALLYMAFIRAVLKAAVKVVVSFLTFVILFVFVIFDESIFQLLYGWLPQYFYKFVEKDVSYLTRLYNPIGDLITCTQYPLGVGIVNVEQHVVMNAMEYSGLARAVIARTSTWSYYFAAFGVLGGISLNLIWIMGVFRQHTIDSLQKVTLLLMMLYSLTSVTLISNQLYWIFIVLLYCRGSGKNQKQGNMAYDEENCSIY